MTQKILEALADENLKLIRQPVDHDSDNAQTMKKMGELRAAFEKALGDTEKELFQSLKEANDTVNLNYADRKSVV